MNRAKYVAMILLAVVFLFWPFLLCHAQAPAPAQDITYVQEGARSPFSGMLFPMDTAARWRNRIDLLEHQLTLDVQREHDIAQIRYDAYEERLATLRTQMEADRTTLQRALDSSQRRGLRSHPMLWYSLGAATVVVLVVTTSIAVSTAH